MIVKAQRKMGIVARTHDFVNFFTRAQTDVLQSDARFKCLRQIDDTHRLVGKLDALREAGARVGEISLRPLNSEDLGQLVTDTLRCDHQVSFLGFRVLHLHYRIEPERARAGEALG